MGGFGSGHHRSKKPTVETARRLTFDEATRLRLRFTTEITPSGGQSRTFFCPQCEQPRRVLFFQADRAACRKCAGLTYRSWQTKDNPAHKMVVAEVAPTLSAGLRALETWQRMPQQNPKDFSIAMATFEALTIVNGQPQAQPAQTETQQSRREETVEDDLEQSAKMLCQLEKAIADSPHDSAMLPKLVNAYVALSNMRDARAKTADDIKSGRPSDGDRLTIVELITQQIQNNDDDRYLQLQGIAMENKMQRSALK
jgi:uncharacterized protein (DUF983 family)